MPEETKKEETGQNAEQPKEGQVLPSQDSKLKAAVACISIVGLILYFIEKEDNRVRFYASQGILIGVAGLLLSWVPVVNVFVGLIELVLIIMTAVKAYTTDEYYKLPLLGDWAEQLAAKKF